MGAEESSNRRASPNVFDVYAGAVRPQNNINTSQSYQRSSQPSVSEFSNNPERYPGFVLVLVLSTGKMEVVTRQEARRRGTQVKIVSNPSESAGSSDDSSFFRGESSNEDIVFQYLQGGSTGSALYFDVTTGSFGVCKGEDRHRYQRAGLLWLG